MGTALKYTKKICTVSKIVMVESLKVHFDPVPMDLDGRWTPDQNHKVYTYKYLLK